MIFFKYLFIFLLFSFVGWILELVYRSYNSKKFINPGFMSGCVVPLYGFGALIMYLLCNDLSEINSKYKVLIIVLISILLLTLLELISGILLDKLFHLRLWDYSKYKYNYKGLICINFSLIWGILAFSFYYFMYNPINNISNSFISGDYGLFFLGLASGIFIIDLAMSIQLLNRIVKYANEIKQTVDLEKLRLDIIKRITNKKFINSVYPYTSINHYLKEKIKDITK